MKPSSLVVCCALVGFGVLLWSPARGATDSLNVSQSDCAPSEADLTAEVPTLTAFHEVIFELWHDAWPNKDATRIRDLLPRVKEDFAAIEKAALPGILRDKQAAWDKGVKTMAAAVVAYEKAAAGKNEQALLDAVETLHSDFEHQMRIVRPYMKELESYHVFLYQIYHHFAPAKDLAMLAGAVDSLGSRCGPLQAVPPPPWFRGDAAGLKGEIGALCGRTEELKAAARTSDWKRIGEAVESVHDQYLKILALFE